MDKQELLARAYASPDEAFAAIEAAKLDKGAFRIIPSANAGEYLILEREGPKPAEKPAKAEGKAKGKAKASPAPIGGRSKAEREKAKAAKPAAKEMEKLPHKEAFAGPWKKLSDRKWIGSWAALEASAKAGNLPDAMGAKAERPQLFGGIFAAATHAPFEKRIMALAALIRAKDEKGLKALQIKEISTTPIMLGKLRDLAIAALAAKAEKPAKAPKAKGEGNGAAPEAAQPQA